MKKEEFIERYGEEKYERLMEQTRQWTQDHLERSRETAREWYSRNSKRVRKNQEEQSRKGGAPVQSISKGSNNQVRGECNKEREGEKQMKTITVDVRHLEHAYGFDLHEFENGHTYPLSLLTNAMGFSKGTPQLKPRVKGKVIDE